ncbi:MAG: hypothetical protein JJE30_12090 [Desulfuromonadales bacterium]|nr:hypothetical protein [Desulfuromonadales bacterium]
MTTRWNLAIAARVLVSACVLAATVSYARAQEAVVPVNTEPRHLIKLDSAKYRVYDVLVEPGESTLFHTHTADIFAILLTHAEVINEPLGGPKAEIRTQPGIVLFSAYSPSRPFVHRISTKGNTPFRNITIELLQSGGSSSAAQLSEQTDPALKLVRESPRGKAYRLDLEPGQSARLLPGSTDLFVICLSDGRVVDQPEKQTPVSWDCKAGDFRLFEHPQNHLFKNGSTSRAELVIIGIK